MDMVEGKDLSSEADHMVGRLMEVADLAENSLVAYHIEAVVPSVIVQKAAVHTVVGCKIVVQMAVAHMAVAHMVVAHMAVVLKAFVQKAVARKIVVYMVVVHIVEQPSGC